MAFVGIGMAVEDFGCGAGEEGIDLAGGDVLVVFESEEIVGLGVEDGFCDGGIGGDGFDGDEASLEATPAKRRTRRP